MSTPNTVKTQLQNLIDISNRVTGRSDTDLTGVVNHLTNERDSLLDGSVTEIYSEVTELGSTALANNPNLITVTLPNAIKLGYQAISHASSLKNLHIPKVKYIDNYCFYNTTGLEHIDAPSSLDIASRAFDGCTALKYVNLHKTKYIGTNAFYNCSALKTLVVIIQIDLASTNVFTGTPIESGTGYIYIPRNLIESYKTATNWTAFASQFRVLEDYTVDGTVDGELDWDKVNGGTA